ncbi:MAG: hypothetical protein ACTSQI_04185 [Candidatus Helarchaeota archaeon]
MDLENKLYLVIGIPTAFFLFGVAIVLNLFPDNLFALILMVVICIGLSFLSILYISAEIDPVELSRKGIFVAVCILLMFLDLIYLAHLLYFPGDLVALLIGGGIAILTSLIIIYVAMRELNPLPETPLIEYILGIIIILISGVIIWKAFLDDLIGILLTIGMALLLYLFIFLVIHFYRTSD